MTDTDEIAYLTGERPVLWTAWLDHAATGEGRLIMAYIGYAVSERDLRQRIAKTLNTFDAEGCEVSTGVVRNTVTLFLWSSGALDLIERVAAVPGWLDVHSRLHFNLS